MCCQFESNCNFFCATSFHLVLAIYIHIYSCIYIYIVFIGYVLPYGVCILIHHHQQHRVWVVFVCVCVWLSNCILVSLYNCTHLYTCQQIMCVCVCLCFNNSCSTLLLQSGVWTVCTDHLYISLFSPSHTHSLRAHVRVCMRAVSLFNYYLVARLPLFVVLRPPSVMGKRDRGFVFMFFVCFTTFKTR